MDSIHAAPQSVGNAATLLALALLASCHLNPDTEPSPLPSGSSSGNATAAVPGIDPATRSQTGRGNSTTLASQADEDLVPLQNRLGLTGSYSNGDEDDPWTSDGLRLEVDFGHRLSGIVEVGGVLGVQAGDLEDALDPDIWYLGPSGRIYLTDKGQLQPWVGASAGLGSGGGGYVGSGYNGYYDLYYDEFTGKDFVFYRLGAGISYFANRSVALEAGLWYTSRQRDDSYRDYYEFFGSYVGSENVSDRTLTDTTLRLGISWFF